MLKLSVNVVLCPVFKWLLCLDRWLVKLWKQLRNQKLFPAPLAKSQTSFRQMKMIMLEAGYLALRVGWPEELAKFSIFGWSKPTSLVPIQPVASLPMADVMTADQTFTGVKFSNNLNAEVKPIDLDGNGKDTMIIVTGKQIGRAHV